MIQGFHLWCFDLAVSVLLALIGSATVSAIGDFLIVANYLFPTGSRDKS